MEWVQHFNEVPGVWQYLIGVMVLVLGSSAILSEDTAKKKFWLIGRVAIWFQDRKEREAEREYQRDKRIADDLRSELDRMDRRISVLEKHDELQHKYIVYINRWRRALEVWAAEQGIDLLDDPPYKTFREWLDEIDVEEDRGND